MEFSYSQTENFEMEKLSSDTEYFKKPVEINRGGVLIGVLINIRMYSEVFCCCFNLKRVQVSQATSLFELKQPQKNSADIWSSIFGF